jgi:thiol:disulfide interchange protein DsbD
VLASLDQVITLQADVTANDSIDSAFMNSLGIYGPPAILFFDKNGVEKRNRRVVGEMSGEDFAVHVNATFN